MSLTSPLIKGGITATEVLSDDSLSTSAKSVQHTQFDESVTPSPATMTSQKVYTLSTGAATIDLRALYGAGGSVQDANGLKVQGIFLKNLGANVMTFTAGASNGYEIFGASGSVAIQPGAFLAMSFNDGSPDVAAGDKTIDVAGTGSQTFECAIILG